MGLIGNGIAQKTIRTGVRKEYIKCGVLMHASLAITEEGLPLGQSSTRFWSRDEFKHTTQMKRHINPTRIPIEQKESIRCLRNLESSTSLLTERSMDMIHIGDRENDIYEYFCKCNELRTHFIIRSCVNRLANKASIIDEMADFKQTYCHKIKYLDKTGQEINANLEVKSKEVELHPPIGKQSKYEDLKVNIVSAVEKTAPKGCDRIRWTFITNLPVKNKKDIIKVLEWYKKRWSIETFFKVIKSGFKAEESKLSSGEGLARLLAIDCILAWRFYWLTMLNRQAIHTDPSIAFDEVERKILQTSFKSKCSPKSLTDFLLLLTKMGGYLARKNDPPPGNIVVWRGLRKLKEIQIGFEMANICR